MRVAAPARTLAGVGKLVAHPFLARWVSEALDMVVERGEAHGPIPDGTDMAAVRALIRSEARARRLSITTRVLGENLWVWSEQAWDAIPDDVKADRERALVDRLDQAHRFAFRAARRDTPPET